MDGRPQPKGGSTPRCAFLTSGKIVDDDLRAASALRRLGWSVDGLSWRQPAARASDHDLVVIRSTWDYHEDSGSFLALLDSLAAAGIRIENDLPTVRWNLRKTYLRELESRGVKVVPTVWRKRLAAGELAALFDEVNADEIVVKPVVSANAVGTFRVRRGGGEVARIEKHFAQREVMVQPFAAGVLDQGEWSLVFFDGAFSHAVLKTPAASDYRVQEGYGGKAVRDDPDPVTLQAAGSALAALPSAPLYARADLVPAGDGTPWLMELELIEPSLFFGMAEGAAGRFAEALNRRFRRDPSAQSPDGPAATSSRRATT